MLKLFLPTAPSVVNFKKQGKNNRCRYFFTEKLAEKLKKVYICTVKNLKKGVKTASQKI